jgi:hypothetical protein
MNPLSRLLGKPTDTDETPFEDLTPEEQAAVLADEKKGRIQYHRDHIRNGPVKFTYLSTGQQRRRAARDAKAHNRKVNKRHRRQFMRQQQDLATLRGQLQMLGVLPGHDGERVVVSHRQRVDAGSWVIRHYGPRDDNGALILADDLLTQAVAAARLAYTGKQ